MKFARYLEETQTPEWKKAYINYRALKKRITAVRRAEEGQISHDQPLLTSPGAPRSESPTALANDSSTSVQTTPALYGDSQHSASADGTRMDEPKSIHSDNVHPSLPSSHSVRIVQSASRPRDFSRRMSMSSRKSRPSTQRRTTFIHGYHHRTPQPFTAPATYSELLPLLSPVELNFFKLLDAELEKVEAFYLDREKEMQDRTLLLKEQLNELNDHRKLFYAVHPRDNRPWGVPFPIKPELKLRLRAPKPKAKLPPVDGEPVEKTLTKTTTNNTGLFDPNGERYHKAESPIDEQDIEDRLPPSPPATPVDRTSTPQPRRRVMLDPDEYQHAKKRLKKAVLEHYRALQMLHNYRILNVTGFRKALKKFEKVTRIPCIDLYMREKVETSAFASDIRIRQMITEMEDLYATRFVHGDKKRAMARLRAGTSQNSHHFSTFLSGMAIGLALPALVAGIYCSFQSDVRDEVKGWEALLFIYAILLVPVLLAMLIGLNMLVWARTRINYAFIFELDMRTRLDHRAYFETPTFLLATLCWAFWLSFARVGHPHLWPLVWLALTALTIFDPLPVNAKPARYWLLRNLMRQFMSGTRRVEFADFWMGLVFTLSNLYFIPCTYALGFDDWRMCTTSSKNWPVMFVVGTLPLWIRVVQSVKRYYDSRLVTHLVNGGKYGTGILMYLMYFLWRHKTSYSGPFYALYIVTAILYSTYACTWDFLMDWSMLKTRAKHFLLRDEVLYTDHIPLYYLAIVYNALIRFAWIMYIPEKGPNFLLRAFIVGMLEMTRRWVWNFYRLENEHLGNMDQYRVTREVPLPYSLDDLDIDLDEEAEQDVKKDTGEEDAST
ncbi:EXS family protein/ERD1/XPR1/SYG1 family protein [Schizophyllum fasciatum]